MDNNIINGQIIGLALSLQESISNYRNNLPATKSGESLICDLITESKQYNPWFTPDHMVYSFDIFVNELKNIADIHPVINPVEKGKIAIILKTNAPFEGFADFFQIIKYGYECEVMPSSNLEYILKKFLIFLEGFPELSGKIKLNTNKLADFVALISYTESGETTKSYLDKYQTLHLNSKGTSFIISGNETDDEKEKIAEMICMYFGRSSQNIKVLYIPDDYNIGDLAPALEKYSDQLFHNRYFNNYEYRKSAMIINHISFTEIGPLLITEDANQSGFISVLCAQRYKSITDVNKNSLLSVYLPLNTSLLKSNLSDSIPLSASTHNKTRLTGFLKSIKSGG